MQAKTKQVLMLSVLAFLLVIRFIVVPVLDWQQEQLEQIQSKSTKLTKANRVIERLPQIQQALTTLAEQNKGLQQRYYQHTSLNSFKLQLQQQIESIFEQHNLRVKNFNWVVEIEGKITQERAKISFDGKVKDLALLQLSLARLPKLLNIEQWTLNIRKMKENTLGTVNGSLVLTAYSSPLTSGASK